VGVALGAPESFAGRSAGEDASALPAPARLASLAAASASLGASIGAASRPSLATSFGRSLAPSVALASSPASAAGTTVDVGTTTRAQAAPDPQAAAAHALVQTPRLNESSHPAP
jgi:hypothetical protein